MNTKKTIWTSEGDYTIHAPSEVYLGTFAGVDVFFAANEKESSQPNEKDANYTVFGKLGRSKKYTMLAWGYIEDMDYYDNDNPNPDDHFSVECDFEESGGAAHKFGEKLGENLSEWNSFFETVNAQFRKCVQYYVKAEKSVVLKSENGDFCATLQSEPQKDDDNNFTALGFTFTGREVKIYWQGEVKNHADKWEWVA